MFAALRRRLAGRTPAALAMLLILNAGYTVRAMTPSAIAARRADQAFDRQWGTETSRMVNLSALEIASERARFGVRYQPSSGDAIDWAVTVAGIDPAATGFVDYGAGKGRIAMLAARAGFARVQGVEFSSELCAAARANIAIFMARGGAAQAPDIVEGDAGGFVPPPGDVLAYFYNPFGPPVLDEVVARLAAHARGGAAVHAVYIEPAHRESFAGWALVAERPGGLILRAPGNS